MGKYTRHSKEYIKESVRLILEEGWSQAQVAEAADVHPNTVAKWVQRAKQTNQKTSLSDAKDKRIRDLEIKNRQLEKELAFSKKVAAWLATLED